MFNPFNSLKKFLYKHFNQNTAGIVIATSIIGYILSSAAQIGGILSNSELSNEKKSFLLPQEVMDGFINIITYASITLLSKRLVGKLYKTGKWAPKKVHEFLLKKPELKEKIGKVDFIVTDHLSGDLKREHQACAALGTTVASIAAGIVSSSIITPIIRNKKAAKVQKEYIDYKQNHPEIDTILTNYAITQSSNPYKSSGNMRI